MIDAGQGTLNTEVLWDRPCEFPRVAPRVEGADARYATVSAHASRAASGVDLQRHIAMLDLHSGEVSEVALGERHYPTEPILAPQVGSRHELDGWVLSQVYDADAHRTYVAVLDAERIEAGPVAEVHFDRALPYTLHGSFSPG